MHILPTRHASAITRQRRIASVPPSPIAAELLATMPALTGYARFLAGNRADSDDLVQDAVVSMLAAAARFEPGTNFRAWAFTVLRNRFLSEFVVKRRRTVCIDDVDMAFASTRATQSDGLELADLRRHVEMLPPGAQELLALAADGRTPYEAIAARSGSAVGTIKSRVHRTRASLRRMLGVAYGDPDAASD